MHVFFKMGSVISTVKFEIIVLGNQTFVILFRTRLNGPFGAIILALAEGFWGPSAYLRGLSPLI